MKRFALLPATALLLLGLSAFGGHPAGMPRPGITPDNDTLKVVIESVGNELKYAQTEFTVPAGQQVHLVLVNKASVQGLSHNVVILNDKAAIDRVGMAAIQAVKSDYIPDDKAILFHTPLAAPGKTVEVTFTAPSKPGEYPYICTFPGHYVLMRGVMKVK